MQLTASHYIHVFCLVFKGWLPSCLHGKASLNLWAFLVFFCQKKLVRLWNEVTHHNLLYSSDEKRSKCKDVSDISFLVYCYEGFLLSGSYLRLNISYKRSDYWTLTPLSRQKNACNVNPRGRNMMMRTLQTDCTIGLNPARYRIFQN